MTHETNLNNEQHHPQSVLQKEIETEPKQSPFGLRLKSARETLGLERRDVAAQLRLSEKIIIMMEKDRYPADLPVTFIRGYIRAYGKLLEIPEHEVKKALEPIKPKQTPQENIPVIKPKPLMSSNNYFMQLATGLILLTVFSLAGIWWYTRAPAKITIASKPPAQVAPIEQPKPEIKLTAPAPQPQIMPATEKNPPVAVAPVAVLPPPLAVKKTEQPKLAAKTQRSDILAEDEDDTELVNEDIE